MRKLPIVSIFVALLFFLLTPLYGEERAPLDISKMSSEAFYNKKKEDLKWSSNKAVEQIIIIDEMYKRGTYDIKELNKARELASEVYDLVIDYDREIPRISFFLGYDQQISAIQVKGGIAETSAGMFLYVGTWYMKGGFLDEAKKICRMVVVTYTGDSYKGYVRQANFMLEDIKELELKKEASSKKKSKHRK